MAGNIAATKLPSPLIAAIEAAMSNARNAHARIQNISRLKDVRSSHEERSFWKADIEFKRSGNAAGASEARSRVTVMIKCASGRRRSTDVDQYLSHRSLPVPDFYGAAEAEGLSAAIWQFHGGRNKGDFARYSAEELDRLVCAIAQIGAGTRDIAEHIKLRVGPLWTEPLADRLLQRAAAEEQPDELQSEIAFFRKIEAKAIKDLHSYGPAILNHNDLTALNVILGDDGLIRIVDWENASLGPPGASLRKFANHDPVKRRRIAELYSGYMTSFGIPLRPDDVIRVMLGQQAFWYLTAGLRSNDIWRIEAGLQLARSAFGENGSTAC